jgi:hypothetical protein
MLLEICTTAAATQEEQRGVEERAEDLGIELA